MADSLSIAQRLDRLPVTPLHIAFLALGAFGLFADIAEVALSNAFSGIFLAPPYNVSRSELSLLLASVFAGGALGAPAFGWLADRYGRQIALQLALAVLAASSLAVAATRFSDDALRSAGLSRRAGRHSADPLADASGAFGH